MKKIIAISFSLVFLPIKIAIADDLPEGAKISCDNTGNNCVAVGTVEGPCFNCQQPVGFVSHDGKKTWQKAAFIDIGDAAVILSSIDCSSDIKHCLVSGSFSYGHENSEYTDILLLISHDQGQHWKGNHLGCGGLSFAYTIANDYSCDSSWSHCVTVGYCTHGMVDDRIYPVALYLSTPDTWSWAHSIDLNFPYARLNSVSCAKANAEDVECTAIGEASDNGSKWKKITLISIDSGNNWKYVDSKKEPYTYAKLAGKM